jgi:hypothetical protein
MRDTQEKDREDLAEKFAKLSDDELFRIINLKQHEYRPEALTVARLEMSRRGHQISQNGKVIRGTRAKPSRRAGRPERQEIELRCHRCSAPMNYVGTRRLHEDKSLGVLAELGEMFKAGASEFLDVYVCQRCGRVELFVDGIGEEYRPY